MEPPERPGNQYEQVANDLVGLSFLGKAVYLREQHAAEKYGISRTAMRQIFERLAGLGILEHVPRKGWSLRPFRYEYLMMFAEAREMMEVGALRLAQIRLVEEDLRRILDRNILPVAESERPQSDNSLHEYLILKSKNLFIKDFFDRYQRYYDVLHRWEQRDREAGMESVRQHRRIAEALIRREWAEAEHVLIEHIHHSQAGVKKLFEGDQLATRLFGSEFRQFIQNQLEER
jgi:DNA-binding GntR family transcriptional regulator